MKHQEFIEYLTHPSVLGDASLGSLTEVVDKFPYFQTAHLLVAKNLYNQNNINYNEQLKIAAIYATDRSCLYNLIYNYEEVSCSKPEVSNLSSRRHEFQLSKFQEEENNLGTTFQIEKEPIKLESAAVLETTETLKLETTEAQNTKPEASVILVTVETSETSSPQLTTHNPQPVPKVTEHVEVVKAPVAELVEATTLHNSQQLFSEWLKSEKVVISIIPEKQPNPIIDKKPLSHEDLIDQFIKSEPKIKPSKADFYSPALKAKESLKEHDDFVSETLAKVYARQGNISKSINIYDKLRLKYPEKSSYFAEEIKKLKDSQLS